MYNFTDGELLTAKKLNDTFLECRTEAIDNSLIVSHTNGTSIQGSAQAAYWKKARIVTGIVFAYPSLIQDGFTYMPEAGFPVTFQEGVCSITCTPLSGINNAQFQCQPPPGPIEIDSLSTEKFRARFRGGGGNVPYAFMWTAIGY